MTVVLTNIIYYDYPHRNHTAVCGHAILLREPLPWNPTAETALQSLIWCSGSWSAHPSSFLGEFLFSQTPAFVVPAGDGREEEEAGGRGPPVKATWWVKRLWGQEHRAPFWLGQAKITVQRVLFRHPWIRRIAKQPKSIRDVVRGMGSLLTKSLLVGASAEICCCSAQTLVPTMLRRVESPAHERK